MFSNVLVKAHANSMSILADWDFKNLFEGAQSYAKDAGGALIVLLGIVMIIWGGVKLAKKLMGNQQQGGGESWFTIILLIFIGGALMIGGFTLLADIAEGGKKTIEDIGNGFLLLG